MPTTPVTPSFSTPANRHSELLRLYEREDGGVLSVSPLSQHFAARVPSLRNLQSFNKIRGFYRVERCRFDVDIRINPLIAKCFVERKRSNGKRKTQPTAKSLNSKSVSCLFYYLLKKR